jgi:UDP-2-acetamido-2-deoxy-ribo-hexuluronate aminotransferase
MDFIDLKTQYRRLKPSIDARLARVFEHGQYIHGPEVAELESVLARYAGTRHCVAASSGTDTLMIAMMALGIGAGDEVITSPFTFIATGEMIALLGAKPVFVDIDARTYNIDPALIEAAITPRTRAIMPVSLYGQCPDLDAINRIAAAHGLPVIEDAAQSFGATYRGRRSCALSLIGSTSFFPSKPLGAYGDGGALFTDDDALAKIMAEIRVHGQDRRYHHPRLGINGRLDAMQAAILLAKMEVFEDEVAARARLGARYTELFGQASAGRRNRVRTPWIAPECTSVFAQYTIEVDDRPAVETRLREAGIPTAVHYPVPLHLQPVFAGCGYAAGSFPVAEAAAGRVISLPMHPYLTDEQQRSVVDAVHAALSS